MQRNAAGFSSYKILGLLGLVWLFTLLACNSESTGPYVAPVATCDSASVLHQGAFSVSVHQKSESLMDAVLDSISGIKWLPGDSVRKFFGDKDFKLVFSQNHQMYLVTYDAGASKPTITLISHGDENVHGTPGSINSPLFSPDGNQIVFSGNTNGRSAFIQDAISGPGPIKRFPVEGHLAHVTSDPHWHSDGTKTWIYFATLPYLVFYSAACQQIPGATYRVEVLNDSTGPVETTGIPGAYRGGISKDGKWVGTAYATSALYDVENSKTVILDSGAQQCNPSMNPYPIGSKHMDYFMTLAFGGTYKTITGQITENSHENFWIYNKDNRIIWQAPRPQDQAPAPDHTYLKWDKPEWSAHPNYATAVAVYNDENHADLYVVKIGDLANADEVKLDSAVGYLKIGEGGFNPETFSHLWVAP